MKKYKKQCAARDNTARSCAGEPTHGASQIGSVVVLEKSNPIRQASSISSCNTIGDATVDSSSTNTMDQHQQEEHTVTSTSRAPPMIIVRGGKVISQKNSNTSSRPLSSSISSSHQSTTFEPPPTTNTASSKNPDVKYRAASSRTSSAATVCTNTSTSSQSNSSRTVVTGGSPSKKRKPPPLPLVKRRLPNRFKTGGEGDINTSTSMNEREEHRAMVAAIFDVGVEESSPVTIFDHMSSEIKSKYSALNLEKIKSKLQKYRKLKEKNKTDFMRVYDSTLDEILSALPLAVNKKEGMIASPTTSRSDGNDVKIVSAHSGDASIGVDSSALTNQKDSNTKGTETKASPQQDMPLSLVSSLSSGEVAAYLTYQAMTKSDEDTTRSHNRFMQQQEENGGNKEVPGEDEQKHRGGFSSSSLALQAGESSGPFNTLARGSAGLLTSVNGSTHHCNGAANPGNDPVQFRIPSSGADVLEMPTLTQAELESPLGHAFQNFLGVYNGIMSNLQQSRAQQEASKRVCVSSVVSRDHEEAPASSLSVPSTATHSDSLYGGVDDHLVMPPPPPPDIGATCSTLGPSSAFTNSTSSLPQRSSPSEHNNILGSAVNLDLSGCQSLSQRNDLSPHPTREPPAAAAAKLLASRMAGNTGINDGHRNFDHNMHHNDSLTNRYATDSSGADDKLKNGEMKG